MCDSALVYAALTKVDRPEYTEYQKRFLEDLSRLGQSLLACPIPWVQVQVLLLDDVPLYRIFDWPSSYPDDLEVESTDDDVLFGLFSIMALGIELLENFIMSTETDKSGPQALRAVRTLEHYLRNTPIPRLQLTRLAYLCRIGQIPWTEVEHHMAQLQLTDAHQRFVRQWIGREINLVETTRVEFEPTGPGW
jgi:hypothetical protein